MADYIDRDEAIDEFNRFGSVWMEFTDDMSAEKIATMALKGAKRSLIEILKELPSADIQPVPHGRWVLFDGYYCSNCNYKIQTTGLPSYCPSCGARMDGE